MYGFYSLEADSPLHHLREPRQAQWQNAWRASLVGESHGSGSVQPRLAPGAKTHLERTFFQIEVRLALTELGDGHVVSHWQIARNSDLGYTKPCE